jgi:two-component system, chemotaxis family, sensor kinase CheA
MTDYQASPELLIIYLEDARSHLEALDHCLLSLERDGLDHAVVAAVLGPLHTLKGNSGMMGLASIKEYVHRLEDVFSQIADGAIALTPAHFDQLFAGASALRDAVERACAPAGEIRDLGPEKAALDRLLREGESHSAAARQAVASASAPLAAAPAGASAPGPASLAPAAEPRSSVEALYAAPRSSTVRVDFSQLDHLLNLVGELIIARTKLLQLGKSLVETVAGRAAGRELMAAVQHVGGVSSMLQETVMDIRMLPVRHVFERFPRLVRDLSREQGKEIELILEGETTRVDKAIIDEIGEPLVHLIRNSVDHGIETPEERVARGKTRTGTILLSATQESNQVVITIMDDGAGIDASRVYRKAVERGILQGDESLTDREAVQLIFSQGFSTRESITDVSGRGMGLDVVLKSIERLNGLVEVETVPGVGTKFIIQLPLTLAIISVLLVEVSGRTYAVPLSSVVETLRLDDAEVHRINHRETLRLRERIVPVLRLAALFGLAAGPAEERSYVVIVGRGDKRVGIVVDRLKGQQEVVIKALDPAVTGEVPVVAGATIMGDGRVVLILDVAALFEGRRQGGRAAGEIGPGAVAEGRRA